MKKIYQIAVILVLFCNNGTLEAQITSSHLMPVNGIFGIYDSQFEYYSKVRKVLFNGLTNKPEIRFLVMPAFTPENVLDIECVGGKCYIIYHICEKNIGRNTNWEKVKVIKFKSEIDSESVRLIKSLFEIATAQVRYPDRIINQDGWETITIGFDGVNYYFSTFIDAHGVRMGMVWSPNKGSKMERLVMIGDKLIELVKSEKKRVTFDAELRKSIENLIEELK